MALATGAQVDVRRLSAPEQPLLEAMYDTFIPLGEALGLPPRRASQRHDWLITLGEGINLAAFAGTRLLAHLALLPIGDGVEMVVFVHQDFRRRGIGTALVRAAVGEAQAEGCNRIVVMIDNFNKAARQGLLKFGFLPIWHDMQEAEYEFWLNAERRAS